MKPIDSIQFLVELLAAGDERTILIRLPNGKVKVCKNTTEVAEYLDEFLEVQE